MTPERLAELQARASRPRRTVPVVCNGDLAQRIDAVQAELTAEESPLVDRRLGSRSNAARVAALEAELDDLYERAAEDTLLVVVEAMEGTAWRALLAAHPPKPLAEGEEPPTVFDRLCDREAMEEPLIRACAVGFRADVDADVQPLPDSTVDWLLGYTDDDGNRVRGFMTAEKRDEMFVAAWAVSRGDDAVPLRRKRSTTLTSVDASPPPARSASRSAASTAGNRRKSTNTTTSKGA